MRGVLYPATLTFTTVKHRFDFSIQTAHSYFPVFILRRFVQYDGVFPNTSPFGFFVRYSCLTPQIPSCVVLGGVKKPGSVAALAVTGPGVSTDPNMFCATSIMSSFV